MNIQTAEDLAHFWMPFTDNRRFKQAPRILSSASGVHYFTDNGQPILDGTSGLWCVNAGHGREEIASAVADQVRTLDFGPTFQLGHPKAFEFAKRVADVMPRSLNRIFFTNSGSESADSALKIALGYHRAKGNGTRTRLIGRKRGYHGTNFGGTSVGGIGPNRSSFGAQVWGVDHIGDTHRREFAFSRGLPSSNTDLAAELEDVIALHGAENIAALIVEPVACSTGVLVPPRGYLNRLREITAKYGILLIFDEVITAFGRVGAPTASAFFGVTPDILTMAKGLTNGVVPMGAVAVNQNIYDSILQAADPGIEFYHGYTYSGHPLASAAGIATLDIYRDERLFERAFELSSYWEDALHSLRNEPFVIDIRNIGLIGAVELESRPTQRGHRAFEIFERCFAEGLLIRVTGEVIALSPPLTITHAQIDEIIDRLRVALRGSR